MFSYWTSSKAWREIMQRRARHRPGGSHKLEYFAGDRRTWKDSCHVWKQTNFHYIPLFIRSRVMPSGRQRKVLSAYLHLAPPRNAFPVDLKRIVVFFYFSLNILVDNTAAEMTQGFTVFGQFLNFVTIFFYASENRRLQWTWKTDARERALGMANSFLLLYPGITYTTSASPYQLFCSPAVKSIT